MHTTDQTLGKRKREMLEIGVLSPRDCEKWQEVNDLSVYTSMLRAEKSNFGTFVISGKIEKEKEKSEALLSKAS